MTWNFHIWGLCRQHEPAAVNLFFSAFTWKSFVPIKWEDTSHLSFNMTNMKWSQNNKPIANGSILKCRFRFSRYRGFLNIFRIKMSGHNRAKKVVIQKRVNFDIERLKLGLLFTAWLILDALESSIKQWILTTCSLVRHLAASNTRHSN